MSNKENIAYNVENDDEKWDNGELGCNEQYVKVADEESEEVLEQALKN